MIRLIELYQKSISGPRPDKCKYFPSCSEYAKQAILGYGAVIGIILAAFRLLKCNPVSKGGFDYVPEKVNLFGMQFRKDEKLV
ncbi:MAG: membrane protein insertion efficiency factor YidD [Bifidobacteriaceae bacterium]|jgi:putative membrane protein insertion efficiency factor|nr:membrane protein insertion efficiency factor YidD [Bifidobacteriaceae bacterium]